MNKPMFFAILLVFAISSIYSVSAQNYVGNTIDETILNKARGLDNELNPTITATLTGLSLTGASFLMSLSRSDNDTFQIHLTKKYFIKAFFMFLLCTIVLFVFNFIQILDEKRILWYTVLDVIITFALFGIGVMYLARAAKQLYSSYGK